MHQRERGRGTAALSEVADRAVALVVGRARLAARARVADRARPYERESAENGCAAHGPQTLSSGGLLSSALRSHWVAVEFRTLATILKVEPSQSGSSVRFGKSVEALSAAKPCCSANTISMTWGLPLG